MYRPTLLVQGRTSHQLSEQEVELSTLLKHQRQAVRKVSGTGLITPEMTGPEPAVGTPNPRLSMGASDIRGLDIVAPGLVVFPHLSQGIVVWKMRARNNVDVLQEVLVEPVGIGKLGARIYTQEKLGR